MRGLAWALAAVFLLPVPPYTALLTRWSGSSARAVVVAGAVDEWSAKRSLDPALVLGVIRVENKDLKANARAADGSVGVMQVQPQWLHSAFAKECGRPLSDVRVNVCYGTAVLALAMQQASTVEAGLLRYNGCTRKSCRVYVTWVLKFAQEVRDEAGGD